MYFSQTRSSRPDARFRRFFVFCCLIGLSTFVISAADLQVGDKTYENYRVIKSEPDGLTIAHKIGIAKIPFPKLSKELQEEYKYDPKASEVYQQTVAVQEQKHRAAQQLLLQDRIQKANAEKLSDWHEKKEGGEHSYQIRSLESSYNELQNEEKNLVKQIVKLEEKFANEIKKYRQGFCDYSQFHKERVKILSDIDAKENRIAKILLEKDACFKNIENQKFEFKYRTFSQKMSTLSGQILQLKEEIAQIEKKDPQTYSALLLQKRKDLAEKELLEGRIRRESEFLTKSPSPLEQEQLLQKNRMQSRRYRDYYYW